jgi:putative salt-induced outer membrane protein YdiY
MLSIKNILFLCLSLFLLNDLVFAQIVNMESARKENLSGFQFQANLGLNGSSGTVDRTNYSVETRLDYNSDKWQRFGVFSYKREEKDDSITSNNTFFHLRAVRKVNNLVSWEVFSQLSEKPLQKIKRRELFGAGVRLSPYKTLRIGLGLFDENEERILSETRKTTRLNTYITNDFKISDTATFESTLYIQPDINDLSEVRSFFVAGLRLKINEKFSSIISYENTYDSSPPPNTDESNSFYGIKFSFEY